MKRMMKVSVKAIQHSLFIHISLCSIFAATFFTHIEVATTHQTIQLDPAKDFAHLYIVSPILRSRLP